MVKVWMVKQEMSLEMQTSGTGRPQEMKTTLKSPLGSDWAFSSTFLDLT